MNLNSADQPDRLEMPACGRYGYGHICELPQGHEEQGRPHEASGFEFAAGVVRWRCHAWGNEVVA